MDETNGAISRREALKTTAKAAGVAAFVAPVVVGVFSAQSVNAGACTCSTSTDSDAVPATVANADVTRNANCKNNDIFPNGRYVAQDISFSFLGGAGSIGLGLAGNDQFGTELSFYTITSPANYCCQANWTLDNCATPSPTASTPINGAPQGALGLPWCIGDCSSVKLVLVSVTCCPV